MTEDTKFVLRCICGIFGLIFLMIAAIAGPCYLLGIEGFGPYSLVQDAKIISKHIDAGKDHSSYMITTDKGTFEISNGFVLGIWNSDEIYGTIKEGKFYNFSLKGNKRV